MGNRDHAKSPQPDVTMGHEVRDVHAGKIALSAVGLAVLGVAACVLMFVLFNALAAMQARRSAAPSPLAATYGRKEPPEPRLQVSPLMDMVALRARDAAALHSYAWVDRQAGVVRIPIERAIAVLAERGLPARVPIPEEQP